MACAFDVENSAHCAGPVVDAVESAPIVSTAPPIPSSATMAVTASPPFLTEMVTLAACECF